MRELSGLPAYRAPFEAVDEDALERAKKVIDAFDAVLILERLAEHAKQLCAFGWRDVRHTAPVNVRGHVSYMDVMALGESFRERLRAANRLDGALFYHASLRAAELTKGAHSKCRHG